MVTDNEMLVLRSALVQGLLSATITLLFTLILEKSVHFIGHNQISLLFIVPIICSVHSKSKQNIAIFDAFNRALNTSAKYLGGNKIPGGLFAPLPPIAMQASIAISVNVINQTPNLWLTVTPSIVLTAIYGYMYTYSLLK